MKPHWEQVRNGEPHTPEGARVLRVVGGVALLASLGACLGADYPSIAVLVWVMALTTAALAAAMTLAHPPRALTVPSWVSRRR